MNIEIRGLSKIYPNGHAAIRNVDLDIGSGMFGLLGPNGAGKSSFMRTLVTLQSATSGSILIEGMDINEHRQKIRAMIGYLPQDFTFFSKLKTWEFLDYAARLATNLKKKDRLIKVDYLLDQVGLLDVRERMANKLSGGMKRRLGIAQALIGDPKLLVIDEPTTGLDPEERIRFRNILSDLSQKDVTIILSTHIVGDISSTCHNMAMLNKGEVAFKGSPEGMIDQVRGHVWQVTLGDEEFTALKNKYSVVSTIPVEGLWEAQLIATNQPHPEAKNVNPNLEHAYVYFMENQLGVSLV
ncbi:MULTISPECIES: ABC transporter ATP-binding protein [unclassified Imperialibacter]|uniref:ABC transporter ATP-binding protein n=1 Tax=unclassified Imperialibacter TaxID=2629706 RepID=UPI00125BDD75|nr:MULTISPECIES: ABC transporter ATP-binding protein [unclassified Imperialibacter]CAD5277475.1 Multidrug ABC transporter ATP-binding protein [Imperialibacter sp. 75]CAD5295394.1 Multidrug ABC transporter ATP-binding protein [Imperialibacter sp. 89]VVT12090.1 ABC transporter related protein [Imperialibacter sp. EC-SDR9]